MTKKQSWQELESNLGARGDRQKKGISEAGHVCSRTSVACCDQEQGKKKKCGRSSEAFAFMETFSNYINNLLRHSHGALNSANLFHACSFSAIALQ